MVFLPYLVLAERTIVCSADCQCGGRHVELTSSHARTSQLAGLAGGQGRQEASAQELVTSDTYIRPQTLTLTSQSCFPIGQIYHDFPSTARTRARISPVGQ